MAKQPELIKEIETLLAADGRVDTALSVVFFKDRLAYKLKREIKTGFVDYSTLRKRKAMCEREFLINKKNSPDLYIAVAAVCRGRDGALKLWGGKGPLPGVPVEYLVEMNRFREKDLLSNLARAGSLDSAISDVLIERVAAMHAAAPRVPAGNYDKKFRKAVDISIRQFRESAAGVLPPDAWRDVSAKLLRAFERCAPVLKKRGKSNIKDCHGDLHLGNVCLYGGRPRVFDAVEFNPEFTHIDTFYDLAFLLMDYHHHRMPRQAERAADKYLAAAGLDRADFAALMPLYMGLRAVIRSSISAAGSKCVRGEPQRRLRAEAVRYHGEALEYLE
ncbi:MAG: hypothetical protein A2X31_09655 [Elusimicrobia bacterium GWB2_63_22]|nr:MAG: hypothetical protein A2X31_09655 [Elusimicrobia bacterium GWB2_63_22]